MRFRKKPVEVEAVQFTADMNRHSEHWFLLGLKNTGGDLIPQAVISTLEGEREVNVGDWMITGTRSERCVVKDDIFRETYEPVEAKS